MIDGKPQMLLCGELQYFRMPKEHWGKALDRLSECGCNAVAYYVPWFVHEYEEGKFDFTGKIHPSNDLRSWIKLTKEKGLLAYFRPGPYVYAETTDLGIPKWFTNIIPMHTPRVIVMGNTSIQAMLMLLPITILIFCAL
jgi:beta-galactosidase